MTEPDFQSDELLTLLTDALRAGPGSPSWHDAVQRIAASGPEAKQYQQLLDARQRLESGKGYRSIRPGPGFTRKVLAGIEASHIQTRRWPMLNIIAALSGLLMLITLLWIFYLLYSAPPSQPPEIQQLALTHLTTPAISLDFNEGLPSNWEIIGQLPLDLAKDFHPSPSAPASPDYVGGGLVCTTPIDFDEPFALQVTLQVPKPTADCIVQVFISKDLNFSPDRATSERELVWMLQAGQSQVILPGGQVAQRSNQLKSARSFTLEMKLDNQTAILQADSHRLYAGPHQLDPKTPCYIGVRFLQKGTPQKDSPLIRSIQVLKK